MNETVDPETMAGLKALGAFGLQVPEELGMFSIVYIPISMVIIQQVHKMCFYEVIRL